MKKSLIIFSALACLCFHSSSGIAQGLFDSDEVLHITLSGSIRELTRDIADDPSYHAVTLSYTNSDSSLVSIPVRVKTRGHFRRKQGGCTYPPLLINFPTDNTPQNSLFHEQEKLKLVTPCRGDKYVVREYLAYKVNNVIT